MRLGTFTHTGRTRVGAIEGDLIIDLGSEPCVPKSLRELLAVCPNPAKDLKRPLATARRIALDDVQLEAPISDPRTFLAVGLNYPDHAREGGHAVPARPRFFTKLTGSIAGPRARIVHPGISDTLDYEGELGVVIGRRCRAVSRGNAREVIAGFLILNDLSLREWVNPDLLVLGKGCATFAPMGPWLTTVEEVPDPQMLRIQTEVNGELRQDASTDGMLFDCGTLIEWITRAVELHPGDIIATGSPRGSGIGFSPPRYLKSGDTVRVAIDTLGELRNTVAPAAADGFVR